MIEERETYGPTRERKHITIAGEREVMIFAAREREVMNESEDGVFK